MRKRVTLIIVSMFLAFSIFAQNVKIEPANWWCGLKMKELQLMVHAKDVGKATVSLQYPGVSLQSVYVPDNSNYLFINLLVDENLKPGSFPIDFLQDGKKVFSYNYEFKKREFLSRKSIDQSDLIYLFCADRFANGNLKNDQIDGMKDPVDRKNPNARHGGDIAGISKNLEYFKSLGVSALWSMPMLENNMDSYSYHGYAATDFYKIDPRYGTNDEFKNMVSSAHAKDIKIIADIVLNHCGSGHKWITDMPEKDWLNVHKNYTQTNFRSMCLIDPHHANSDVRQMADGWFVGTMPDLNQRNPRMAKYLIQNSIWWCEYSGIDGIRLDTQPYADLNFMSQYGNALQQEYPGIFMVGEAWMNNAVWVSYFQGGKRQYDGYDSNIPSVFDFPSYFSILEAFNEKTDWKSGLNKLYNTLTQDFLYANPDKLVTFIDNHDLDRFTTLNTKDSSKLKLALAFIATTRGIPLIYYQTEIMAINNPQLGDGDKRSDFPGGWSEDKVNVFTKANLSGKQLDILNFTQKLFSWRKTNTTVQFGKLKQFIPWGDVYVYFKYTDNECVMTILNSDTEQKLDLARFKEVLKDYKTGYEILTGKKYSLEKEIVVPAKTPMILELSK